jgi:uncharacterized protein YabE (DUF348 family)/3D (Asp-Asp-Asp) domain-containing protein
VIEVHRVAVSLYHARQVFYGLLVWLALWIGYVITAQPVTLLINGRPFVVRLHQPTVANVVQAVGLALQPQDQILPPFDRPLTPGQTVTIQLARPVTIEADGQTIQILTQQNTVAGVLAEVGLTMNGHDTLLINGVAGSVEAALPAMPSDPPTANTLADLLLASQTPRGAVAATRPEVTQISLRRAVLVTLHDKQVSTTFYTTQPTIAAALQDQGLSLFAQDQVIPALTSRLAPGLHIYIQRSTPVAIAVDGQLIQTRTRRHAVGEILAQEGIALMGLDFSRPSLAEAITPAETIQIVRVREETEIEAEYISFETEWVADETLELDQNEVRQAGVTGVIKTRTRVRYEDGQEIWRTFEDKWLDQTPSNRIIAYGTKVLVRSLDTPKGPVEYWRRISMLLTPYTAATSGKVSSDPLYGITRSGLRVGYGIAAVDPKVIPLGSKLYVPNYGQAVAADTGGLIIGKHIDLAFEENQPIPDLYGWGDVYLLTPVPPADRIRYVLPQYPQR